MVECVHLPMLPAKLRLGRRNVFFTNNRWCSRTKINLWTEFQRENDRGEKNWYYVLPTSSCYYHQPSNTIIKSWSQLQIHLPKFFIYTVHILKQQNYKEIRYIRQTVSNCSHSAFSFVLRIWKNLEVFVNTKLYFLHHFLLTTYSLGYFIQLYVI